jgi:predicted ATPase
LGQTLHFLGYPELGFKRSAQALSLAQATSNPHSLAFAENFVSSIHLYRRVPDAAETIAEDLIALAMKQGTELWHSHAQVIRGCAITAQGHPDKGITEVQEGLASYRATRTELGLPGLLCLLAEGFMHAGRVDDGLTALAEAQTIADRHQEHGWDSEIDRVRGELLLRKSESNRVEAETCFKRAIEVAQQQSARWWELRATVSLARLLASQGRREEGRARLAEISNWFSEGFDTADLKDAKALLGELGN